MGVKLLTFVYNVMRESSGNRQSKNWLPKVFAEYLPIKESTGRTFPVTEDILEDVNSISMIVQNCWRLYYNYEIQYNYKGIYKYSDFVSILNPRDPSPKLTIKNMVIDGLSNLKLCELKKIDFTDSGGCKLILNAKSPVYSDMDKINVKGDYVFTQEIWAADSTDPTKPTSKDLTSTMINWPVHKFVWEGKFSITISNDIYIDVDAELNVSGGNADRDLAANVIKTYLYGLEETLTLKLDEENFEIYTELPPNTEESLRNSTMKAFAHPSASSAIMESINKALNERNNIGILTDNMQIVVRKALNDQFSTVPKGMLPTGKGPQVKNKLDQYLFDRVRYAINNESCQYYLPSIVKDAKNPTLEPFYDDRMDLGSFELSSLKITDSHLSNLKITGFSNIHIKHENIAFNDTSCNAKFKLDINISAKFNLNINGKFPLTGELSVAIKDCETIFCMLPTGYDLKSLKVAFDGIKLQPQMENIIISVKIQSIFGTAINELMKQNSLKTRIIDGVNEKLAKEQKSSGETASVKLRQMISDKLEGR